MTIILNKLYFFLPLILLANACTEGTTNRTAEDYNVETLAVTDTTGLASATFASGCFWCTEAYFERVEGVKAVISGYAGGEKPNPTYQEVSAGLTDYAEVVQVYYNPEEVSYEELVEVFFATHDPTTLNRQGPDIGAQYRSIAFYRTPEEEEVIRERIRELEEAGTYRNDIVTEVQPFEKFWEAEAYHQDYYLRNPNDPYVVSVARPKVEKFVANYQNLLKPEYMQ